VTTRLAPQRPHTVPKTRICLSCDKGFWSNGPWNRICKKCSASAPDRDARPRGRLLVRELGGQGGPDDER